MVAKFRRRAARFTVLPAFLMTFVEAILTLTFVRLAFRLVVRAFRYITGRGRSNGPADTVPLAKAPVAKVTEGV
jgi:hypothetical protein